MSYILHNTYCCRTIVSGIGTGTGTGMMIIGTGVMTVGTTEEVSRDYVQLYIYIHVHI